ncbi:hypothetical protein ATE47_04060 [Chryseobacterium sp. IHB B 17019]|uniref:hypothetical protein n=1 Tax=Chryseobacterium sp. IHB B 17019 TaxID=1721091 RepID=UPI000720183B|nr:hypothetical protein [Chryseobacterium sp. IHB B 17019]ALR29744.1 hypothetical protein ATE47_04060 [Chryseobacterium sp. IHB B 17019]
MKQLELRLQKRLLIVEYEVEQIDEIFEYCKVHPQKFNNINGICKLICKGSEFNEDIARGLAHSENFGTDNNPDVGYYHSIKDNYWAKSALESFVSSIEKQNYYWGDNPIDNPDFMDGSYDNNGFDDLNKYQYKKDMTTFQEAEFRTFNLENTLIFELL